MCVNTGGSVGGSGADAKAQMEFSGESMSEERREKKSMEPLCLLATYPCCVLTSENFISIGGINWERTPASKL